MIPANAAPPKTIVIAYPGAEERLRQQYVYQTHLSQTEMDEKRIVSGNRLVVKFKDEVVGEGQAILVEKTTLEKVSKYDAMMSGFEDDQVLKKHLLTTVLAGVRKPDQVPFWKILYRWL
jgi:hypothetical protein